MGIRLPVWVAVAYLSTWRDRRASTEDPRAWLPVEAGIVIGPSDSYRDKLGRGVPRSITREILHGPVPPGENALEGWTVKRRSPLAEAA